MVDQPPLISSKTLKKLPQRQHGTLFRALESLVQPSVEERERGLENVLALMAHKRSPLACTVLFSRLQEPDLSLREKVVDALAKVASPRVEERQAVDEVRSCFRMHLATLGRGEVRSLLYLLGERPASQESVCRILDAFSGAGEMLIAILMDRNEECVVKIAAAQVVAEVGYLAAIPVLEELTKRLESRRGDQLRMGFAPRPGNNDALLLTALKQTHRALMEAAE